MNFKISLFREGRKLPQPGVSQGRQLPAIPGHRQLPQPGVTRQQIGVQIQQTTPMDYRVSYFTEQLKLSKVLVKIQSNA